RVGTSEWGRVLYAESGELTWRRPWSAAFWGKHRPTGRPTLPGRVLATTIPRLGIGCSSPLRRTRMCAWYYNFFVALARPSTDFRRRERVKTRNRAYFPGQARKMAAKPSCWANFKDFAWFRRRRGGNKLRSRA